MKRTLLAFIGLAFAAYWFWTADLPNDRPASLVPMRPSLILTQPAPALSSAPKSAATTRMQAWLAQEAIKIKHPTDPSTLVIALKRRALGLKPQESCDLHNIALDSTVPGDERFLAVYMIGLSEAAAARTYLQDITESRVPTTPNEKGYTDEVTVRTHALETLVKRVNPEAATKILNEILTKSNDPSLTRRAKYWLGRL